MARLGGGVGAGGGGGGRAGDADVVQGKHSSSMVIISPLDMVNMAICSLRVLKVTRRRIFPLTAIM